MGFEDVCYLKVRFDDKNTEKCATRRCLTNVTTHQKALLRRFI